MVRYVGLATGRRQKEPWVIDEWVLDLKRETHSLEFFTRSEYLVSWLLERYDITGEEQYKYWVEIVEVFMYNYLEITRRELKLEEEVRFRWVYIHLYIVELDQSKRVVRIGALTMVEGFNTMTWVDVEVWVREHGLYTEGV
jgi:hypothetical protein